MYPLKFKSIYKEKIWGGRRLEAFRENLPEGKNIGESWDMACHDYGDSVVENGKFAGKKISELIKEYRKDILGEKIREGQFPLSIKIITANEKLSIQVHPSEEYSEKMNLRGGRTEAWYIIDADPGAYLYLGIKDCTREKFERALESGTYENCINKVGVSAGDMFYVKNGLLHCIGGGITLLEIHENYEKEYRIYDYNRGRNLDLKEALDVLDFENDDMVSDYRLLTYKGNQIKEYNLPAKFNIEVYEIKDSMLQSSERNRFHVFSCVKGDGWIVYKGGRERIRIGDSYLIPAYLGSYEIEGTMTLVKSYISI